MNSRHPDRLQSLGVTAFVSRFLEHLGENGQNRRATLNPKDSAVDGEATNETGRDHAGQKEKSPEICAGDRGQAGGKSNC